MARTHGTNSRYIGGCRCNKCRRAHADYVKEWRWRRLVDSTATRTSAEPWRTLLRQVTLPQMTIDDVAAATGLRPSHLLDIRSGRVEQINDSTRRKFESWVRSLPTADIEEDAV